jgi:FeS assembly protein IscX
VPYLSGTCGIIQAVFGRARGEGDGQMGLKWDQAQEIAEVLTENHPGINPLQVRFTDLRQWVADLDEFDDDPDSSSESKLEAIQMAWNEIYEENNEDE